MRRVRRAVTVFTMAAFILSASISMAGGQDYSGSGQEDPNKKVLKSGLLGAATGGIAASASGGKAGTGALIGAGTNVVGGALLDTITSSPPPAQQQPVYYQQAPIQQQQQPAYAQSQPVYYQQQEPQPVYAQPQPVYYQQAPPREDPNKKILKSGLLGAATGAIAASASGGKAGKGALIGAGTNVIGGALLDSLTGGSSQPQPQPVYYQQAPAQYSSQQSSSTQPKKRILRRYDSQGNIVAEEEVWE